MVSIFDIYITDSDGNEYEVNDIHVSGNDCIDITIKRLDEKYYESLDRDSMKSILEVCRKYNIPVRDLPRVLEEYILQDNVGWSD